MKLTDEQQEYVAWLVNNMKAAEKQTEHHQGLAEAHDTYRQQFEVALKTYVATVGGAGAHLDLDTMTLTTGNPQREGIDVGD